jgi:hypothetical protein
MYKKQDLPIYSAGLLYMRLDFHRQFSALREGGDMGIA